MATKTHPLHQIPLSPQLTDPPLFTVHSPYPPRASMCAFCSALKVLPLDPDYHSRLSSNITSFFLDHLQSVRMFLLQRNKEPTLAQTLKRVCGLVELSPEKNQAPARVWPGILFSVILWVLPSFTGQLQPQADFPDISKMAAAAPGLTSIPHPI